MRTKTVDEPLHLNLYNFENSQATDSPYVLTSPRSLEACRKAGCKPVELLRKSIEEYQQDLGALAPADVYQLYQNEERHRLNKLETCRAIRRELMTRAVTVLTKENVQRSFEPSTRKDLLDKENLSIASIKQNHNCATLKRPQTREKTGKYNDSDSAINETSTLSPSPESWNKVLCLTGGGEASTPPSTSSFVSRAKRIPPHSFISRKITAPSRHGSLSSNNSSTSSRGTSASSQSTSAFKQTRKLQSCARDHLRYVNPRANRSSNKSLPSSANTSKRHKNSSVLSLSDSSRKGNSPAFDSNNNSNRESRLSSASAILSRRKHVSFGFSPDDLGLSEHDRRILESMALKKELERENDEFAHQAHILWEQDREIREQLNQEHTQKWKEYVAEKRRMENAENTRKWEEMKQSLRKSQQILEQNIREKEELAALRKKSIDEKKLSAAGERSVLAAKRRADVEATQQLLELEAAMWQQAVEDEQRHKLERAHISRMQLRDIYRRRVASANRVEELRHQQRCLQLKDETEAAVQALRQLCRQREHSAHARHVRHLHDRHIHTQSLERAMKLQQVRELHDELELGLQKWQQQVMQLQWEATQRAEQNMTRNVENKRQRVEMENRARRQHHSKLMERILREDEARVRYIRELIMQKEAKMKRMAQERDLAIRESRLQAQTTADLREHLRRTLSPETFDRKVARVALEMRVAGRPPTASPTMTRSHIFLG